jgi:flagellar biosynthesis anti-sigma factor FlgM
MKIESGNSTLSVDPRLVSNSSAAQESTKEQTKADAAAKVSVSQSAASLNGIREQLEKVDDVRADKVAQLKAEVESGEYTRSSDQIASKLLTTALQDALYQ